MFCQAVTLDGKITQGMLASESRTMVGVTDARNAQLVHESARRPSHLWAQVVLG
jgi:hypothetical protein